MKKRILLFTAISAFAFVVLKSDSSGPGGNYTGSSGGAAGCVASGCHHATTATTGIKLGIRLDSMGVPVTKYVGGMTYTVVLIDTNTTTGSLPKHGFECSVVKGTGSASTQAGTWGTVPSGTALHTTASRSIWGHNTPIAPVTGTGGGATGTIYIDSIKWTAPAAGAGTVSFFSVMNNVNSNGTDDANDLWNNTSVSFAERVTAPPTGVASVANTATISAFPNPAVNTLNLQFSNASGTYTVQAINVAGSVVASEQITVSGSAATTINTANWATGLYQLVVTNGSMRQVISVVKK